jgi:hypothetical protein
MPLKDYIQGKRLGKEANQLEREAMNDPFLQEAMDGFDAVAGDHVKAINRLEKRFSKHSGAPQKNKNMFLFWTIAENSKSTFIFWTAAASILLLIGISAFFLWETRRNNYEMAMVQSAKNESEISTDSSELQVEPEMKLQTESALAANDVKKILPVQPDLHATPIQQDQEMLEVEDSDRYVEIADLAEHKVVVEEPKSEAVVIDYGVQKKEVITGAVATIPVHFGEKEFESYCRQKTDTTVCDGKGATVKVSFFIDETGKPSKIEYKSYSCEDAKKEIENLLSSSPPWTKANRKVKMTIKW